MRDEQRPQQCPKVVSYRDPGFRYILIALLIAAGEHRRDIAAAPTASGDADNLSLFANQNLVAWCIVPFDSKQRGPEERAEMLSRLNFSKFAYDYRAEHVPTFDAELDALKRHKIELTAWWFPGELNDEARGILDVLKRHEVKTQLWVTGGGEPTPTESERLTRIKAEAARIRPIAQEAAKIGCRVALYNHGGWFGEPENQIAVIEEVKLPNVGIVYNLHHGHQHLDRFPEMLRRMLPHLYALNLNGMTRGGEQRGQQILPLGQGELDLELLREILASGYRGPIGILGHTQDDAEDRLRDNLDGLEWLVKQLEGQPAGDRPKPRTFTPAPPETSLRSTSGLNAFNVATVVKPKEEPGDVVPSLTCTGSQPFQYDARFAAELATDAMERGDALRGSAVFSSAQFACLTCHKAGESGGAVGPELTDVGRRLNVAEIVESVLWPGRQVKPEFSSWQVLLNDGRVIQGYKQSDNLDAIQLYDPAKQQTVTIDKADIEHQSEVGTLMPDGLAGGMSSRQRRDLVRFLSDLGRRPGLENEVRPEGTIAEFVYDRAPLDPDARPLWQHPVNRDRVYDFYKKEALFFRKQSSHPHLLPAFPGLDGGTYGHWGNQSDEVDWKDGRWNDSDLGTVLAGVLNAPNTVVPKGVCVRLGESGELATCFNPETLTYDAVWRDGFLKFSAMRHGFLDGLAPIGGMLPPPVGERPDRPFVYHGYYRLGRRVVFSYRIGDVEMLDSPWVKDGQFDRIVAPASEHPLRDALLGGASQWPEELQTAGQLGVGGPYAIDTIPLPVENPWKSLLYVGDHDFLPDGSALLCTMQGDVWRATGLDGELKDVRWRRFAAGLHQPLGLVVSDGEIYVLGRDQITRLQDLNGDGEADFYECFCNKLLTSPGGHDFTCGLARDSQGQFYTASGKQGLLRISSDGERVDVLATGLRNPDGVSICSDGAVTVPNSEGDWAPASMICLVPPKPSAAPLHFGHGGPQGDQPPALPLAYLPRGLDNSSGGQIAIPDHRWGPLRGQIVHFSFGQGSHFLVVRDEVDGQEQGAVIPLDGEFRSGAHRGKFNPHDGQLYVSGMSGWGTYTPDDGCFQRVRYTGARVQLPRGFHLHENGVKISFTRPVDPKLLRQTSNHFAQAWNYRYGPGYGSPELAPSHPDVVGHESLEIAGVHLINPTTLFVEIPDLQPVNQLHLLVQVAVGQPQELFITAHRLDGPFTEFAGYRPDEKILAAHPMLVDLKRLGDAIANPWREPRSGVTALEIAAEKNLTYSTSTLKAKAGELLSLTFVNPDVVPHNWVLIKPDSLTRVGELTNKLVADPDAVLHQYVPRTDDVLVYTDIVPPQQQFTIYFHAPQKAGRYPYLCTFPGHWMVMKGELVIE